VNGLEVVVLRHSGRPIAALLLIGALSCGGSRDDDAYWIGAVGQFEGRESARENVRGIRLAIEQANAAGGIHGKPVRALFKNDRAQGDVAVRIAREFVADPRISVVVGHTASAAMLPAAAVYDGKLAAIATTASAPTLSGISKWVFRVMPSDSVTGAQLGRFSGTKGWKSAAILYQNDVYGRGLSEAFRLKFPGRVISSDPISPEENDLSVFVRFYERFRPDVVFVIAGRDEIPVALREACARRGLDVQIIASEGATSFERNAAGAESIYVAAPFSGVNTRPETQRFIHEYTARFGHPPKHDAALAYDATITAFAALRAAGSDRAAVRRYLGKLDEGTARVGATGKVYFDTLGDRRGVQGVILQVQNGRAVTVERD
jgi:branched-chain amino acid transport system substrate-binding protein